MGYKEWKREKKYNIVQVWDGNIDKPIFFSDSGSTVILNHAKNMMPYICANLPNQEENY